MNPDFAKYLSDQPAPAIKLWLQVLAQKPKGGVYVVLYDQLIANNNNLSTPKLKRLFKPRTAQKAGLLQIIEVTETGMAFKLFAKTDTTTVRGVMLKKSHIAAKTQIAVNAESVMLQTAANNQLIPVNNTTTIYELDADGLKIGPVPAKFELSGTLYNCVIGDYFLFYKHYMSYLALKNSGNVLSPKDVLDPILESYDFSALKKLATYFVKAGFKTEQHVRIAFQRVYNAWRSLPEKVQKYYMPRYMHRNFSEIYEVMLQINAQNKAKSQYQTKKDANTTEKINNAGSKDYSHLARN